MRVRLTAGIRLRGGGCACAARDCAVRRNGKWEGLAIATGFLSPCGHGGFSLFVVWAACAAGGKAGPVMGLRPLLGPPCIPPEAPRVRFSITLWQRGLRGLCFGSFPPFGRVISLRAAQYHHLLSPCSEDVVAQASVLRNGVRLRFGWKRTALIAISAALYLLWSA